MLSTKMEIVFYNSNSGQDGYYVKNITSATFLYGDNYYFIGFINKTENIKCYLFLKKYIVDVIFPSIERGLHEELIHKNLYDRLIKICLGNKIIGEAKMIKYLYAENEML